MRPNVQAFFDPATSTATFLVSDSATGQAAIIDPVLDFEPKGARISTGSADAVLKAAADQGLQIVWVLETHAHADHLSAADYLRRKTGAQVVIGSPRSRRPSSPASKPTTSRRTVVSSTGSSARATPCRWARWTSACSIRQATRRPASPI